MRTSLKLFCLLALFCALVSTQKVNFSFKSSSFPVDPKMVLNASNVPDGGFLSSSTVLLPGPVSGTNTLLSVYEKDGKFTFFRQILSIFNGEVINTIAPVATDIPIQGIKYTASTNGWLAFANTENDANNINQVYIYKILLNGTGLEKVPVTYNEDAGRQFRVLSLFNDNKDIGVAFSEGGLGDGGIYVPDRILMNKISMLDSALGIQFPITLGGADFASCDSVPFTGTVYCIFKQDGSVKGAVISLIKTYSQDPVHIWDDTDVTSYTPLYVAALNGYYLVLASAKRDHQISLVGYVVAGSFGHRVLNKWSISNDFVSFAISSVVPYYSGFAIFYATTDASNNQYWYYQAFTKDLDVEVSAALLATVPMEYMLSSFTVASTATGGDPLDKYLGSDYRNLNTDFGNPIGFLGIKSSLSKASAAYYGQVLRQTYNPAVVLGGSYLSSFVMLAAAILGLLLIC